MCWCAVKKLLTHSARAKTGVHVVKKIAKNSFYKTSIQNLNQYLGNRCPSKVIKSNNFDTIRKKDIGKIPTPSAVSPPYTNGLLSGWLHTEAVYLRTVTHLSTNQIQANTEILKYKKIKLQRIHETSNRGLNVVVTFTYCNCWKCSKIIISALISNRISATNCFSKKD